MYANYHTHTFRCGHATGTEEEYIKYAIDGGIKILGFSDHAPYKFPDGFQSDWRVQENDAEEYFETLSGLREKYKDKIKIHIGFEMEYYPKYFEDMLNKVKKLGAEYLILGQHYFGDEHPGCPHTCLCKHDEKALIEYTDLVIEGIKTGEFLYVAHPDMLLFSGDAAVYKREAKRLCDAALAYDIPLEMNFLGINDNRHYPNESFFQVVSDVGNKVIFGFDAHSPERAYDIKSLEIAENLVKKYNLNLIDELEI